jgi:hypothetical protein
LLKAGVRAMIQTPSRFSRVTTVWPYSAARYEIP